MYILQVTDTAAIISFDQPQCPWSNPEVFGYNVFTLNHNKMQESINHELHA